MQVFRTSYHKAHLWFENERPCPERCDSCRRKDVILARCNKPHTYECILEDWAWWCKECHERYDSEHNGVKRGGKTRGKWNVGRTIFTCTVAIHDRRKNPTSTVIIPREAWYSDFHIEDMYGKKIEYRSWNPTCGRWRVRLLDDDRLLGKKVKIVIDKLERANLV